MNEQEEKKIKRIGAYKVMADATLKSWKKEDLIEQIRILEHNWACTEEAYNNSVKNSDKIFYEQKAEIERLTEENERLSDLEFTQEHCDLYQENEYLKECLVLAKEQAVKDTAKEILQELWDETEPLNESHKWVRLRIKNIASRKGVEVE